MALSPQKKIVLTLAALFFFVFSSFNFVNYFWDYSPNDANRVIFSWPDAMANYTFIGKYIDTGEFAIAEPLNSTTDQAVHPRSTNVLSCNIVSMGFLGLPIIFSLIGKVFGLVFTLFITPLLAVLAAVAFYELISAIFDRQVGLISYLLLLTFAPFWYYANLTMLPNVLFCSFVVISLYFGWRSLESLETKLKVLFAILAGFIFGLAVIVRPVELPWLIALFAIVIYANRHKFTIFNSVAFTLAFSFPVSIFLFYNYQTYGSIISSGYLNFQGGESLLEQLPSEFKTSAGSRLLDYFKLAFAPFGFNLRHALGNICRYFVLYLWPYVLLSLATVSYSFYQWKKKILPRPAYFYLLAVTFTALWVFVYYGSWQLADSLIVKNNTIGHSAVRYFLPLGIIILPLVGQAINAIFNWPRLNHYAKAAGIVIIAGFVVFSGNLVYFTVGDGLIAQHAIIQQHYSLYDEVSKLVEPRAIIINNREDKIFFPDYRVVMFNSDFTIFNKLKNIVPTESIYFLTLAPDKDIAYLTRTALEPLNLKLSNEQILSQGFRLYKLTVK